MIGESPSESSMSTNPSVDNILKGFLAEHCEQRLRERACEHRAYIAKLPRMLWFCERDLLAGPHVFRIGVYWDKKLDAAEGELVYRRAIVLRWSFWISLARY